MISSSFPLRGLQVLCATRWPRQGHTHGCWNHYRSSSVWSSDAGFRHPYEWAWCTRRWRRADCASLVHKLLSSEFKEKCIFPLMSREKVQLRLNFFAVFSHKAHFFPNFFVLLHQVSPTCRKRYKLRLSPLSAGWWYDFWGIIIALVLYSVLSKNLATSIDIYTT